MSNAKLNAYNFGLLIPLTTVCLGGMQRGVISGDSNNLSVIDNLIGKLKILYEYFGISGDFLLLTHEKILEMIIKQNFYLISQNINIRFGEDV